MRKQSQRPPRATATSMTVADRRHIELTFYADLANFITAPGATAYNRLMRSLDLISLAMQAQEITDYNIQLRSAKLVMRAIFDRSQRTGRVTVLELEALTLRTAAPAIEAAIERTRLDTFTAANTVTKAAMRAQGAPVEA